jgi:hypothetical protein
MKLVIALLALSSTFLASAAIAADAKELLRDNRTFCSQFVIHDPDPRIVLGYMHDCCAYSRNLRDCRMYDWDTTDWAPIER